MSDINLNELTDTVAKQRAGTSSFLAGQNATSADYLKRYTDFINSQEGASAMASRIGTELGIPTLQSNATMLRNTLTNLPTTYSKATTGYDVSNSQLQRIIGQKASELSPAVTTAENSLQSAQGNLATRLGYETADQARLEKPMTVEQNMLLTRQAREQTMYSEDNQRELDALITKINAGITLSEGERNRAQQLAIAEKGYQNALELAKQNNNAKAPVSTTSGDWMWDSSTGTWVPVYD
jgi:S-adenosylmethionine synthetase